MIKNFNSFLNESNSYDLSSSFIIIKNNDEHKKLMKFLEDDTNCRWISGGEVPTKIGYLSEYPNIVIDEKNILSRSGGSNYMHYKVLSLSDIEKFKGKTKIRKPDEDPFDEENWGFIQVDQ